MNKAQYKVVKTMTNFPKLDTKKFAKMIGVSHAEVLRVQASNNFEQFESNDTSLDEFMKMFGGNTPFGKAK